MLKTAISSVVLVNNISVISIIPTYSNQIFKNELIHQYSSSISKKNENKLVVSWDAISKEKFWQAYLFDCYISKEVIEEITQSGYYGRRWSQESNDIFFYWLMHTPIPTSYNTMKHSYVKVFSPHPGKYGWIPGTGFNHYRFMRLYSVRHAIKERFNLAKNLRSDFIQAYHDGNALKLTFMVGSQKDGKGWMMAFGPFIKVQQ